MRTLITGLRSLFLAVSLAVVLTACGGGGGGGDDGTDLSNNACDAIGLPTRIINGTACGGLAAAPVVRIAFFTRKGIPGFCSGSMITRDDVLTAAHCFQGGVSEAVVSSGPSIAGSTRVTSSQIIVHPNFQNVGILSPLAAFNDVAIVRLSQPLGTRTLPILMSRDVTGGDVVSIFGYGSDENGDFDGEDLKSGEMQVSSVTPNHIAANFNGNGSNTCQGDSGGPMTFTSNGVTGIVGLTSSGSELDCSAGDISLFTNVQGQSIFDFILSTVPDAVVR